MAGGSLFRPAIAALAVAGTTATGSLLSLGTSPTFTFGIAGNTITGSAAGGGGGLTQATLFATGNTTQSTTGTQALSSLLFRGEGIASVGISNGSVVVSVGAAGASVNFSAGTTSANLAAVTFGDANGFSFGLNAGTITGSYTVPTVTNSSWTVSDNATSGTVARLAFTNLNGVTLSLSTTTGGSHTLVGSHNGLTSQSNQALSGQNGSFTFQTASFSNANGISFGTSAGPAITASYTVPTVTNSSLTVSDNATSGTLARLAFTNLNGITLSLSTGAGGSHTIVGSHNALTSQSNQAFSAAGGSSAFQTLGFSDNAAGSFTNTNGSVAIASIRASLFAVSNTTQSSSGTQNLNAISFAGAGDASVGVANGSVVISVPSGGGGLTRATLYATSNTTQSSTGTQALSSLLFAGAGIASVGITNGSVVVSVPAGGGAGDGGVFAGVSTMGNTAGSTGTVSTGNFVLVGTGPISLSQSTGAAGSAATISINGPATSSLSATGGVSISTNGSTISIGAPFSTLNGYDPFGLAAERIMGQVGNASFFVMPMQLPVPIQFDQFVFPIHNSNSSNSSGSHTISLLVGVYTRNASTLSRLTSTSMTTAVTHSGTAGSYSLYSGLRNLRLGWTSTFTGGNYWVAVASRTSSGGANGTYSNQLVSNLNSNLTGEFGVAANASKQFVLGLGLFSASSSAPPGSIAFADIGGTSATNLRAPIFHFASGSF